MIEPWEKPDRVILGKDFMEKEMTRSSSSCSVQHERHLCLCGVDDSSV